MPSVSSVAGLASMQVQFFSLLSKLSMPWPNEFRNVLYVMELVNIDPRALLLEYDWPVVDFRVMFIFVANVLPLMISGLILITFQPLKIVLWYLVASGSFVAIITGLVVWLVEGLDIGIWFLGGGGFIFVVAAIIGISYYCIYKIDKPDIEDVRLQLEEKRAAKLAPSTVRSVGALLLACGGFFVGCVLTGVVFDLDFSNKENNTLRIIGIVLFVIAGIAFIHFVAHLTLGGRKKVLKVTEFFSRNFLMVMLLVLSVSYVPAVTYCVDNFMCAKYSCPVGTKFNPFANRTAGSYKTDADLFCDPCFFLDDRCRIGGTEPQDPDVLCPAWSGERLWKTPEVPCKDSASIFFLVSACLVLPTYLILVPVMYIRLIEKVTTEITKGTKLVPRGDENVEFLPPLEAYDRKVFAVEPACAAMYQPFKLPYRYYSLPLLFYRLVIVIVAAVLTPYLPQDAIYVLLGVHFAVTLILVWHNPFISKVEYGLSLAMEGCNILNCVYALLVMYELGLPGWVAWIVVGLNVIIPVSLAIATTRMVGAGSEEDKKMAKKHRKQEKKAGAAAPRQEQKYCDEEEESGAPLLSINEPCGGDEGMHTPLHTKSQLRRERVVQESKAAVVEVPKGEQMTEAHRKALLDHNDSLAQALNEHTAGVITKYFMVIGCLLMIALGASVLGYLKHQKSEFRDGSSRLQRSYKDVLGGYASWSNFTDECCCITTAHPKQEYILEERWVCRNGNTVDRGRQGIVESNNGLPIRGFCHQHFNFSMSVTVNDTIVNVVYHDWAQLNENGITSTAREFYW